MQRQPRCQPPAWRLHRQVALQLRRRLMVKCHHQRLFLFRACRHTYHGTHHCPRKEAHEEAHEEADEVSHTSMHACVYFNRLHIAVLFGCRAVALAEAPPQASRHNPTILASHRKPTRKPTKKPTATKTPKDICFQGRRHRYINGKYRKVRSFLAAVRVSLFDETSLLSSCRSY